MFKVQKKQCNSCIYKKNSPLNIRQLEEEAFKNDSYRICHHTEDVCCAGFWERHKDHFNLGRIAQRRGWVEFVSVNIFRKSEN